jgi:hypothetical protein
VKAISHTNGRSSVVVSSYDSHKSGGTGFNSAMCSTYLGLTKPDYSFGVSKLVPALARVNAGMLTKPEPRDLTPETET